MSDNPPVPPNDGEAKPQVQGQPLDLEDLLALAPIDSHDKASARVFFDEHAPDKLKGALD